MITLMVIKMSLELLHEAVSVMTTLTCNGGGIRHSTGICNLFGNGKGCTIGNGNVDRSSSADFK